MQTETQANIVISALRFLLWSCHLVQWLVRMWLIPNTIFILFLHYEDLFRLYSGAFTLSHLYFFRVLFLPTCTFLLRFFPSFTSSRLGYPLRSTDVAVALTGKAGWRYQQSFPVKGHYWGLFFVHCPVPFPAVCRTTAAILTAEAMTLAVASFYA